VFDEGDSIRAQIREEVQSLFENQLKSLLRQEVKDQVLSSLSSFQKGAALGSQSLTTQESDPSDSGFALSQSQISSLILQGLRSGG
jgi:hypothetical protein